MTYITRDREAGNEIEKFGTEEEALTAIDGYEEEDRKNGDYTDGFYEVVESE